MNKADLISRAAVIAEVEEYLQGLDSCISEPDLKLDGYKNGLQVAINALRSLPSVDAVPVEWLEDKELDYRTTGDMFSDAFAVVIGEWQKEQEAR